MAVGARVWVLFLIVIALLPGLLATVYLHIDGTNRRIEEAQETVDFVVAIHIAAQRVNLDRATERLGRIADVPEVRDRTPEECDEFLAGAVQLSIVLTDLAVVNDDLEVECAATDWPELLPTHVTANHARSVASRSFATGASRLDEAGRPVTSIAYPFAVEGNRTVVLHADLDLRRLFDDAQILVAPPGRVIMVLTEEGEIILREPQPELAGAYWPIDHPLMGAIAREESGRVTAPGPDEAERLYAFARMPSSPGSPDAYVVFGIPHKTITEEPQRDLAVGLLVTIAGALLVFLVAWRVSERRLVSPLRTMERTAHALAAGRLHARSRVRSKVTELQQLSTTMDEMGAAIENLDKARTDLMNSTAHRLRTPLAALASAADILDTVPPGSEAAGRAVVIIRRNTERLAEDIQSVLTVTRFQSGPELKAEPVDLGALAQEENRHVLAEARSRHVTVTSEVKGPVPVRGDAEWLRRAVREYLENALRAAEGGNVHLAVHRSGDEAQLIVRDTGRGFTASDRERLFQAYGHTAAAERETESGLGLGLFLVRLIIEHHDGRVWANSDGPAYGAEFGFAIPLGD